MRLESNHKKNINILQRTSVISYESCGLKGKRVNPENPSDSKHRHLLTLRLRGCTNHRNGPKWTGMEQEWTEMEHFLLKINNNFNHDTLKCN